MIEKILLIASVVTGIGGIIGVLEKLIIKPIKQVWTKQIEVFEQNDSQTQQKIAIIEQKLDNLIQECATTQDDVADMLGDQLMQAHTKFMSQGWCTESDKKHFVELHARYTGRGHNHLAEKYEHDLLSLPNSPEDLTNE